MNIKKIVGHSYITFRSIFSFLRSKPSFIIIGAQKGGTSSLFDYLNQHPNIHLSIKKETHYYDKYYSKGFNWYIGFFPLKFRNKVTGEATPCYLKNPLVAKRVKKDIPNVKLIIMLRNPIDRAFSHYNMMRKTGVEPIDSFEEAIAIEKTRLEGEELKMLNNSNYFSYNHQYYSYKERGLYYKQLKYWIDNFDTSQMLFIKSEDFFSDPKSILSNVYKFLNINQTYPRNLKPSNVGNYTSTIKESTIIDLKRYFNEDLALLHDQYGISFK